MHIDTASLKRQISSEIYRQNRAHVLPLCHSVKGLPWGWVLGVADAEECPFRV